jgi:hypothetical protein
MSASSITVDTCERILRRNMDFATEGATERAGDEAGEGPERNF